MLENCSYINNNRTSNDCRLVLGGDILVIFSITFTKDGEEDEDDEDDPDYKPPVSFSPKKYLIDSPLP